MRLPLISLWLICVLAAGMAAADDSVIDGVEFQSAQTRALQQDTFANPGLLWRDIGETLFTEKVGTADQACSDCHTQQQLIGSATRYPQFDTTLKQMINLAQRINWCRTQQQHTSPLEYESDELLGLTSFVAQQSNGMEFSVTIDGSAKPFFAAGRNYYFQRRGQLNLACDHCHEQNVGRMLRGDRLSQGHSNGYPAYRFEWQELGSLHRRLRACNRGVRAEPFTAGAPEYVNLELYLAWRARNLPLTVPAVRR